MFAQPAGQLRSVEFEAQPASGGNEVGEIERLYHLFTTLAAALDNLLSTRKPDLSTGVDFYEEVTRFEVGLIKQSLRLASGSQIKAAKMLNLKPTTLNNKIKVYKIDSTTTCCALPSGNVPKL
jgi:DNA-binding NtrC family response regulator